MLQLQGAASRRGSDAAGVLEPGSTHNTTAGSNRRADHTAILPSPTHHAAAGANRRGSDIPEHGPDRAGAGWGDGNGGSGRAVGGGKRVIAINAAQLREKESEVRALRGQLQEREQDVSGVMGVHTGMPCKVSTCSR